MTRNFVKLAGYETRDAYENSAQTCFFSRLRMSCPTVEVRVGEMDEDMMVRRTRLMSSVSDLEDGSVCSY